MKRRNQEKDTTKVITNDFMKILAKTLDKTLRQAIPESYNVGYDLGYNDAIEEILKLYTKKFKGKNKRFLDYLKKEFDSKLYDKYEKEINS